VGNSIELNGLNLACAAQFRDLPRGKLRHEDCSPGILIRDFEVIFLSECGRNSRRISGVVFEGNEVARWTLKCAVEPCGIGTGWWHDAGVISVHRRRKKR
jgi:hypothetical protein